MVNSDQDDVFATVEKSKRHFNKWHSESRHIIDVITGMFPSKFRKSLFKHLLVYLLEYTHLDV